MWHDVVFATRLLRKSPIFTIEERGLLIPSRRFRFVVVCAALVSLASAIPVAATETLTTLFVDLACPECAGAAVGEVVASANANGPTGPAPVEMRVAVSVPGKGHLGVRSGMTWQVELRAPGYWAQPRVVVAMGERVEATLAVLPTGRVVGRAASVDGRPVIAVSAHFRGVAGEGTAPCRMSQASFDCEVPGGVWDVKVQSTGWVSQFFWGMSVKPSERLDLGRLRFQPGSSVVGWVELRDRAPQVPPTHLELSRYSPGLLPEQLADRQQLMAAKTDTDKRGFFQLSGIPSGQYVITARRPGYAVATVFPVRVVEGEETELQPVVLDRPLDLVLEVQPDVDTAAKPWTVHLSTKSPVTGVTEIIGQSPASNAGVWMKKALNPGQYIVRVLDSGGNQLVWEQVELSAAQTNHAIEVPLLELSGSVRLGDSPLPCRLWFGTKNGRVRVALVADNRGEFLGYLPHAGAWPVELEATDPKLTRRIRSVRVVPDDLGTHAKVEIVLPDSSLEGDVVGPEGSGVADAMVTYEDTKTGELNFIRCDKEGKFEARGLVEGDAVLIAEGGNPYRTSTATHVQVGTFTGRVRLMLRDMTRVHGVVLARGGPLSGVTILGLPHTDDGKPTTLGTEPVVSGVDGTFQLEVPTATVELSVIALSAGFGLTTAQFTGPFDRPLSIRLVEESGALRLTWEAGLDIADPDAVQPVLLQNGVPLDRHILRTWQASNGDDQSLVGGLAVSHMAAGEYVGCMLGPEELMLYALGMAALDTSHCARGVLQPYGELSLRLATQH